MRFGAIVVALVLAPLTGCFENAGDEVEGSSLDSSSEATGVRETQLGNATLGPNATAPGDMTGGHAPHIHNYWGDTDRVTLFDDVVDLWWLEGGSFDRLFGKNEVTMGGVYWELPEGSTVYEGTGQIEVTATWTDPTITGLSVSYKSADKNWDGFSELLPLTSGTPLVIETTPAMTDMPHQAVSRWYFYFGGTGSPSLAQGAFDLKVDIVRMRDVMAFPGHPQPFQDVSNIVISDSDFTYKSQSWINEIAAALQRQDREQALTFDKGVPMDTEALVVEITLASTSTTSPLARQVGLELYYLTAGGNWDEAVLLNQTGEVYTFGIAVEPDDVDSPYAEGSQWRLWPRIEQRTSLPGVRGFNCGGCFDTEIQGHLKAVAFAEDPTGKLGKSGNDDDDDRR